MGEGFAGKAPLSSPGGHLLKRFALGASLVALSLAASAPSAAAAVTLGQVGTPSNTCGGNSSEWLIPPGNLGNSYAVPTMGGVDNWTVTSWSHQARSGTGQKVKLKVYRPLGGLAYRVVSQDVLRDVTENVLNRFQTSIPAKAGDVVGFTTVTGSAPIGCGIPPSGQTYYFGSGDNPDGAMVAFTSLSGERLNLSVDVEPTSAFSLGETRRNKKQGTATLTVNLPNPGELTGSGKGVKVADAAVISKTVTAPGVVKLTIRAKGAKKTTLNETGKVKVKPKITYTPTGGYPTTRSKTVNLKKKL